MIKAICKELYNAKLLALETPVPTPSVDEIEIIILEPNLLNINPKPAIVAQLVSIAKFEKLSNPLIFDKN